MTGPVSIRRTVLRGLMVASAGALLPALRLGVWPGVVALGVTFGEGTGGASGDGTLRCTVKVVEPLEVRVSREILEARMSHRGEALLMRADRVRVSREILEAAA